MSVAEVEDVAYATKATLKRLERRLDGIDTRLRWFAAAGLVALLALALRRRAMEGIPVRVARLEEITGATKAQLARIQRWF